MKLLTNQYQLKLGSELNVYQYDVTVLPEVMSDSFIIQNVFKGIKRQVESIFGLYLISGRSLYSTYNLEETLLIETKFQGIDYKVSINAESKTHFCGKTITSSKMEDHNVIFNLINIVIKQALRETDLR